MMATKKDDPQLVKSRQWVRDRAQRAAMSREISEHGRDIGELPPVEDQERRDACLADLAKFNLQYFPERFPLPFSDDHLRVIAKQQEAIESGGLFAIAMPRGSGKTTLTETAALFAAVHPRHDMVMLIGADKEAAVEMLQSIKIELETNELFAADFPEVCIPFQALENSSKRCQMQLYKGQRTGIVWKNEQLTFARISDRPTANNVSIVCRGITGKIRGAKHTTLDGKVCRPTLVIVDDPQTDESADSPTQSRKRHEILTGAVLGLAGPTVKMSGVIPCTVIKRGDLADRLLDREISPEWHGERCQMLYSMPDNLTLWHKYNGLRVAAFQEDRAPIEANKLYEDNLEEMQRGSKVAWPDRYNREDERDGLQHAMNLYFRSQSSFESEYQNEPPAEIEQGTEIASRDYITTKLSGYPRQQVPPDCQKVVAFIDVQLESLWYAVLAVRDDFTGTFIDYGCWPEQPGLWTYTLKDIGAGPHSISRKYSGGLEGRIFAALDDLGNTLVERKWITKSGTVLSLSRCLIDANWGQSTDVVYRFCAQTDHRGIFIPSHGRGITAARKPLNDYERKSGDLVGDSWRVAGKPGRHGMRYCIYDSNYWKTFVHARLAQREGDPGSISVYSADEYIHRMFADHMHAEFPVRTKGQGRELTEWALRAQKPDNHLFDCAAGCCVTASIESCRIGGEVKPPRPVKTRRRRRITELSI